MSCSTSIEVHRYHDGELSAAEATRVEAHLRECSDCRELHAELARLSEMLAAAPMAAMSPTALARLRRSQEAAYDWAIRRAAGWLTAAAAAVLVGALLTWPSEPGDLNEAGVWQTAAVTPSDDGEELLLAAQWMADDLSVGQMR